MISYLKGKIIDLEDSSITLATDQIGYQVFVTKSLLAKCEVDRELELFIHTRVREDDISLYGFAQKEQRFLFRQLIAINKVGPKLAMEMLSIDLESLKTAIIQKNSAFLSKIPGIGNRTAERICLDLQNKISASGDQPALIIDDEKFEEVINALIGLGYQRYEINKFLNKTELETLDTEEIITQFLQTR